MGSEMCIRDSPKTEYVLQGVNGLEAAVGIDNLYKQDDLTRPIELTKREPELLVTEQGDELCLSIADLSAAVAVDEEYDDEDFNDQPAYSLKPLSEFQYQLTVFSAVHLKVAKIIGESGLLIPVSAKQKALDGIAAVSYTHLTLPTIYSV